LSAIATRTAKIVRVSVAEAVYGRELRILTSTSRTVTPPGILAVMYGIWAEMRELIVRDGASCRAELQLRLRPSAKFRVGGKSWHSTGKLRAPALVGRREPTLTLNLTMSLPLGWVAETTHGPSGIPNFIQGLDLNLQFASCGGPCSWLTDSWVTGSIRYQSYRLRLSFASPRPHRGLEAGRRSGHVGVSARRSKPSRETWNGPPSRPGFYGVGWSI
jgi:hypothetical protein